MTLETFFEKFDQFADAPNAVPKMRELVLQWAVRGRLVRQDPSDEPAEELIRRVAVVLPEKPSENPFLGEIGPSITAESEYELPQGWSWLPLGHVGIWATGCGFPKQYQGETEGEFLFCKVSDMNLPGNEVEIHSTVNCISAEVMKRIRARVTPPGTVIFPKIGGAIATNKRRLVIRPTVIDNNCSGIQPIGLTDDRWLLQFMRSLDLTKYQSGTSVPAVSRGALDPIRIGLPPLAEQKRIVAKVDELMALCDRLEAQQQERETRYAALARASLARFADAATPANLDFLFHESYTIPPADLRKSILTLAVQGKLVLHDPNDGDQRESATGVVESGNEITPPYEIPDSWVWTRLGDVARFINGDRSKNYPSRRFRVAEGVPFINAGHLVKGDVALDDMDYITEAHFDSLGVGKVERGDVLYCLRGSLGKSAVVSSIERGAIASSLLIIRPSKQILAWYLYSYLTSPLGEQMISKYDNGSAQPNLSAASVKKYLLPLPPMPEQRRIVAKVNQLMALVDQLEAQLAATRITATALMEAVVAEMAA